MSTNRESSPAGIPDDIFPLDPGGDIVLDIHGVSKVLVSALHAQDLESGILTSLPSQLVNNSSDSDSGTEDDGKGVLSVLVSSDRLTDASPHFANMLGSLTEAMVSNDQSMNEHWRIRIDLPLRPLEHAMDINDESLAFLYLLVILHGQGRFIPVEVPLDILVALALLVDFLGEPCYQAAKGVADIWVKVLNGDVDHEDVMGPAVNIHERLAWVLIGHVFKREDVFRFATKAVLLSSEGKIESMLPIPAAILESLNANRTKTLTTLTRLLTHLREPILSGCRNKTGLIPLQTDLEESYVHVLPEHVSLAVAEDLDNQACVNAVLRAYEAAMEFLGILTTVGLDFEGLSVRKIVSGALRIDVSEGEEYLDNGAHERCSVSWRVRGVLGVFEMPAGLQLEEFQD
ncbi:uncharacterized protein DSM5745_10400 [Aspergillus mulundensis]|uniref:Uncharacterized protein n=1 Tax=Aspergillus mulundensis TaxID=1810919 RepID=A0A3D8QJ41_9EURO|nr:hypothetical protein DSM5745_10400 [Aspergillus mulundensis]RDW61728.1 hypothetical protein DSM5745_10400 [Aspergillus mulundensis]